MSTLRVMALLVDVLIAVAMLLLLAAFLPVPFLALAGWLDSHGFGRSNAGRAVVWVVEVLLPLLFPYFAAINYLRRWWDRRPSVGMAFANRLQAEPPRPT